MNRKVPADAFERYVALGDTRTYAQLAKDLGVSRRAITKRATQERWTDRLAKIEEDAREISDRKLSNELADMQERHLKMVKVMGARVLNALRDHPIENGMDAIRAADLVIKLERLLHGESSKRTELSIEEISRREIHTLLTVAPADGAREVEAIDVDDAGDAGLLKPA